MSCLELGRGEREGVERVETVWNTSSEGMQRWAGLANTGGGNVVVGGLRPAGREERQVEAAGLRLRHPASAPRREDGETRG